jgi:hypothetical protein
MSVYHANDMSVDEKVSVSIQPLARKWHGEGWSVDGGIKTYRSKNVAFHSVITRRFKQLKHNTLK